MNPALFTDSAFLPRIRDGNRSGQARIMPTCYPTRKKKSYLLSAPLPVGYPH